MWEMITEKTVIQWVQISYYLQYNQFQQKKCIFHMNIFNEQDNELQEEADLPQTKLTINKISNFLEMKNIFISEFWQSNRNYASPQDIENFCEISGLRLGIHDQINLKTEIFANKEVVSIYQFCDLIPQWKQRGQEMIGDFLKERSELLVQNLNKGKNHRIKSSSNHNNNSRGFSASDFKKHRLFSASKQQKSYKPNNSKKYLQQHHYKSIKKEQELASTIEKTKNQYEYGMLMKMNEINEYNRKNKSSITYRAYKNAEGVIKVRVFDLDSFKKELNIKQFESEYKIFKKSTKENKYWERPASLNSKGNENKNGMSSLQKNLKKEERQEELKNLLVSTVSLTKLLQQQIKIFKMRGIYGCENLD